MNILDTLQFTFSPGKTPNAATPVRALWWSHVAVVFMQSHKVGVLKKGQLKRYGDQWLVAEVGMWSHKIPKSKSLFKGRLHRNMNHQFNRWGGIWFQRNVQDQSGWCQPHSPLDISANLPIPANTTLNANLVTSYVSVCTKKMKASLHLGAESLQSRSNYQQILYNYWTFATLTLELLLTEFLNIYRKKKRKLTNKHTILYTPLSRPI